MIFLLSLLFASLSLTNAALPVTMTDPKQFIQSLEGANPTVLKNMIDMVKNLIVQGEAERKNVIDAQVKAQSDFNDASAEKKEAEKARNTAAGLVQNQQEVTQKAIALEESTKLTKDEEQVKLTAAKDKASKAAAFLTSEIARINAEKVLLQKILTLLDSLLPGVKLIEGRLSVVDYIVGRNLLSHSNADRDDVEQIVIKVNAMVGVGVRQLDAATKADQNAKNALADQKTAHDNAVKAHASASTALGTAKASLSSLEKDLGTKEATLKDAKSTLDTAKNVLADKKSTRETEETRLNGERKTLQDIDSLLQKLYNASK